MSYIGGNFKALINSNNEYKFVKWNGKAWMKYTDEEARIIYNDFINQCEAELEESINGTSREDYLKLEKKIRSWDNKNRVNEALDKVKRDKKYIVNLKTYNKDENIICSKNGFIINLNNGEIKESCRNDLILNTSKYELVDREESERFINENLKLYKDILGEERLIVSDIAGTTRDAIDSKIESEFGKFTLIDTAGLRRKSKVKEEIERYSVIRTLAAVERADVCILMIDATEGVTEQDEKIIGFAHELNKAIMVIVNKWDLIEKDDKTMDNYKKDLQSKLKFIKYAKFLFISALTGQRAHKVLEVARECYDNYDKRIGTGVLNEVINKAVLMKEPPVVALKRLKIYYATQVATKPPKFVFFVNDSSCRHFSYERYLENQLRDNFDFSGTGIQIEYRERKDS